MPRRRKHRLWSVEEKRAICQQTRAPGVSVAQVARRYALNANLIFKWLRDPRFTPAAAREEEPMFLPVDIRAGGAPTVSMASAGGDAHSRIEIVLASGHRMSVAGPFDGDAVARLLSVLTRP